MILPILTDKTPHKQSQNVPETVLHQHSHVLVAYGLGDSWGAQLSQERSLCELWSKLFKRETYRYLHRLL